MIDGAVVTEGSVRRAETYAGVAPNLESISFSYQSTLDNLDAAVRAVHPHVTQGSLNNCHGDWYEWMIAIDSWNYIQHANLPIALLKLPNVSQFDVARLYKSELYELVVDLRRKVADSAGVELITSNPDFVIIDANKVDIGALRRGSLSHDSFEDIKYADEAFRDLEGHADLDGIKGYFSVKTSFRPDRRLQISHEGSLMKALHVHMQTRGWVIESTPLSYFAGAIAPRDADITGLRTVATHSIITVQSRPQAAVDEVFAVKGQQSLHEALDRMSR